MQKNNKNNDLDLTIDILTFMAASIFVVLLILVISSVLSIKIAYGAELNISAGVEKKMNEVSMPVAGESKAELQEHIEYIISNSKVSEISANNTWKTYDAKDSYLLCKIAQAEAGNQSKETKKYIIKTVLNRVDSDLFPNTVEEVIYQDGQFSPVSNGTFDLNEPTQECWDALEEVEQSKDNAYGCLYFESCSDGNSWQSRNLKYLFQSDAIRFYK